MDRPAQEPPERPDPPIAAADSPLSFPVEASPPPEVATPAEAFRAGDGGSPGVAGDGPAESPLSFPVEAPRPPDVVTTEAPRVWDSSPGESPLSFPAEASRPAQPPQPAEPPASLPFPVARLPEETERPQQAAWPPQQATEPPQQAAWPPQPAVEAPHPAVPLPGALRFLPAMLVAVAALLAALGSFLPLFLIRQHLGRGGFIEVPDVTVSQTAWGSSFQYPGQEATDVSGSPMGIPLLVAVALLTVAAFFAAARPGRALARTLTVAGAAFTAGAVTAVAMSGFGWSATDQIDLDVVVAPGLWLLFAAPVVAVVAAVVAHLAVRQAGGTAGWADPAVAYADTPTPPSGVAITVLPPDDERP